MSKTLADEQNYGEPIDMIAFARELTRRRAEYEALNGPVPVPRNGGARRTESKQALLKAIDEAAAKQGFKW